MSPDPFSRERVGFISRLLMSITLTPCFIVQAMEAWGGGQATRMLAIYDSQKKKKIQTVGQFSHAPYNYAFSENETLRKKSITTLCTSEKLFTNT